MALQSEALGFDYLWIYDHFLCEDYRDPEAEQISADLECMMVLSALAAMTKRIRVGSLVLCNSYHNPSLTAKMAATLDVISDGSLEFGIGAGWKENEYLAYGFPFPTTAVRIAQPEETVIIIKDVDRGKAQLQGKIL